MGIAYDLLVRQASLASDRVHWESAWQDIVALAMPFASQRFSGTAASWSNAPLTGFENRPQSVERSRELYRKAEIPVYEDTGVLEDLEAGDAAEADLV